jgi:hypothetical protein
MSLKCKGTLGLVELARQSLPASAYPRKTLMEFLHKRGVLSMDMPKLSVVDVFNAGESAGLMCRFVVARGQVSGPFVAPLNQLAIDRRHPLARVLSNFWH